MNAGKLLLIFILLVSIVKGNVNAESPGWYTEGDFKPAKRIKITVSNPLDINRDNCPVVILRDELPFKNVPQRWLTVVDPSLPPNPEPTKEQKALVGGYILRKETNGHALEFQMDDIDKDGIWDEFFFMIDMKANESRDIYLYIGANFRGLFEHKTHAGIGYYGKHMVPFWESVNIGWKLWFETEVDLHGKRDPMLTAYPEYSKNLSGYFMPKEYGSDIMTVSSTFGAGGICLFEVPSHPDSVSRPRFAKNAGKGPLLDTRYSFDVIHNGPLRSSIRVKIMNWNSGNGIYRAEQLYTAYAHKSYSICNVIFKDFFPAEPSTAFGCGIRKIMNEYDSYRDGGTVISMGKNIRLRDPDESIGEEGLIAEFEGIALVVGEAFKPEYKYIKGYGGNHVFKLPPPPGNSFEYMILGGWSEGAVNNNAADFKDYVKTEALKFNNPVNIKILLLKNK